MEDKAKSSPPVRIGEFVIEISDPKCRNIMWPPTREILRGELLKSRLNSDEQNEITIKIPDMPGIRIKIDPEKAEASVFDPLSDPSKKADLREAENAFKEHLKVTHTAMEGKTYRKMSANDVKSWVHWACRLVESRHAKLVSGSLPSKETVENLPGKTGMSYFDSSARGCKFLEDFSAYVDAIFRVDRVNS